MRNIIKRILLLTLILTLIPVSITAQAASKKDKDNTEKYTNPDTGYDAYVIDDYNYLSSSERKKLLENMKPITEFCNVVYLTDENNVNGTESYSQRLSYSTLETLFPNDESAVIYLVDDWYDYVASQGAARKIITSSKAYTITDNVYSFSAKEKFYEGATEAFAEIEILMKDGTIPEPLKYVGNAFFALFIAMLINYSIVNRKSKLKPAEMTEIVSGSSRQLKPGEFRAVHSHTSRTYSPRSSSSGGGHGGGGHGGGGHSGGGHSH